MRATGRLLNLNSVWIAAAFGLLAGGFAIEPRLLVVALAPVAFALVVWRAELSLAMLVVALYLNLSEVVAAHVPVFSVDKTIVPVAIAAIAFRLWREGRRPEWDIPLAVVLAGYGLSMALSLLFADTPSIVLAGLEDFAKNVVILAIVIALASNPPGVRVMLWSFFAAALVLGGAGTVQFLTESYEMTFGGLAELAPYSIVDDTEPPRLTGPLDDPNAYAQVLVPLVALTWGLMLRRMPGPLRALAAIGVGLVLMAIVATYSRSALVTLAALSIGILLTWHRRHIVAATLALVLLAVGGAALVPQSYYDRVAGLVAFVGASHGAAAGDQALHGRRAEMQIAVAMTRDHPLRGVGVGHYVENFQAYSNRLGYLPRQEDRQAHSLYLEIAAERGLLGILAFAGMILFVFARGLAARRRLMTARRFDDARMVEAFMLALAAYLVFAVVLHRSYEHYFWLLVGALLAASGAASTFGERVGPVRRPMAGRQRDTDARRLST